VVVQGYLPAGRQGTSPSQGEPACPACLYLSVDRGRRAAGRGRGFKSRPPLKMDILKEIKDENWKRTLLFLEDCL